MEITISRGIMPALVFYRILVKLAQKLRKYTVVDYQRTDNFGYAVLKTVFAYDGYLENFRRCKLENFCHRKRGCEGYDFFVKHCLPRSAGQHRTSKIMFCETRRSLKKRKRRVKMYQRVGQFEKRKTHLRKQMATVTGTNYQK